MDSKKITLEGIIKNLEHMIQYKFNDYHHENWITPYEGSNICGEILSLVEYVKGLEEKIEILEEEIHKLKGPIYYIKDSEGNLTEVDVKEAKKHGGYGIMDEASGHIFSCDTDTNNDFCLVCGAVGDELTTECCEYELTLAELEDISKGKMDYRYGRWIWGVVNKSLIKDAETLKYNHKRIKTEFSEDIKNETELGKRIYEELCDESANCYEKYGVRISWWFD